MASSASVTEDGNSVAGGIDIHDEASTEIILNEVDGSEIHTHVPNELRAREPSSSAMQTRSGAREELERFDQVNPPDSRGCVSRRGRQAAPDSLPKHSTHRQPGARRGLQRP